MLGLTLDSRYGFGCVYPKAPLPPESNHIVNVHVAHPTAVKLSYDVAHLCLFPIV
jgi:hypothetical protein